MSRNLVSFEEESYLIARYDLVREVRTVQIFFLTLLIVRKEDINHNHDANLSHLQVCLANSEVDEVNRHKSVGKFIPNCNYISNSSMNQRGCK